MHYININHQFIIINIINNNMRNLTDVKNAVFENCNSVQEIACISAHEKKVLDENDYLKISNHMKEIYKCHTLLSKQFLVIYAIVKRLREKTFFERLSTNKKYAFYQKHFDTQQDIIRSQDAMTASQQATISYQQEIIYRLYEENTRQKELLEALTKDKGPCINETLICKYAEVKKRKRIF